MKNNIERKPEAFLSHDCISKTKDSSSLSSYSDFKLDNENSCVCATTPRQIAIDHQKEYDEVQELIDLLDPRTKGLVSVEIKSSVIRVYLD